MSWQLRAELPGRGSNFSSSRTFHGPLQTLDRTRKLFGAHRSCVQFAAAGSHKMKDFFSANLHVSEVASDLVELIDR
jgi:hypothetical protein